MSVAVHNFDNVSGIGRGLHSLDPAHDVVLFRLRQSFTQQGQSELKQADIGRHFARDGETPDTAMSLVDLRDVANAFSRRA